MGLQLRLLEAEHPVRHLERGRGIDIALQKEDWIVVNLILASNIEDSTRVRVEYFGDLMNRNGFSDASSPHVTKATMRFVIILMDASIIQILDNLHVVRKLVTAPNVEIRSAMARVRPA